MQAAVGTEQKQIRLDTILQQQELVLAQENTLCVLRARTMQGPLRGFHQDLYKIFSQGPVQDHARTSWRGFRKHLPQSAKKVAPVSSRFCWGPRSVARGRLPWQPRVADFVRDCAIEMHMDISQGHFYARMWKGVRNWAWSTTRLCQKPNHS